MRSSGPQNFLENSRLASLVGTGPILQFYVSCVETNAIPPIKPRMHEVGSRVVIDGLQKAISDLICTSKNSYFVSGDRIKDPFDALPHHVEAFPDIDDVNESRTLR